MTAPARIFDELPDDRTLAQCRDRLAKDADLKQYTTGSAVADLEAVRQALGYGKINLLGTSYGTRVAIEYLRRHESSVRAIVLSGVLSPGFKSGLNAARDAQEALKQLFALCEGRPVAGLPFHASRAGSTPCSARSTRRPPPPPSQSAKQVRRSRSRSRGRSSHGS